MLRLPEAERLGLLIGTSSHGAALCSQWWQAAVTFAAQPVQFAAHLLTMF
jgi:hypothetical protein